MVEVEAEASLGINGHNQGIGIVKNLVVDFYFGFDVVDLIFLEHLPQISQKLDFSLKAVAGAVAYGGKSARGGDIGKKRAAYFAYIHPSDFSLVGFKLGGKAQGFCGIVEGAAGNIGNLKVKPPGGVDGAVKSAVPAAYGKTGIALAYFSYVDVDVLFYIKGVDNVVIVFQGVINVGVVQRAINISAVFIDQQ